MKRTSILIAATVAAVAALGLIFLVDWDPERSRREAFVYHCNEEGAGGMFTYREYCEELYARSQGREASGNSN